MLLSAWTPEGKTFKLFRLFDHMVGIQISAKPDKNDDGKQNKSRTVIHCSKEWKQKNPKGNVIRNPDESKGVRVSLFD